MSTDGQMVEFTKVNGRKISSTAKVFTLGLMGENMRVTMKMTKSMDSVLILGPMENPMRVNGQTESSTEKPDSLTLKEEAKWASGRTVKESNGSTQSLLCCQNHQMPLVVL